MGPLPPLDKNTVQVILQSLMDEASKPLPLDEPYNNAYQKTKLALLRQQIRIVDLWVQHERFNEIESRLDRLDGFVSDIKLGMFSDEAAKWIRSKNGVLQN